MSRKYDQDPPTPDTALRRRLDGVDTRLAVLDGLVVDVAALGRGLAELTGRIDALARATNRAIVSAPNRAAGEPSEDQGDDQDDDQGEQGQPDWLTVTDPEAATAWLTAAVTFAEDVLARFPSGRLPACWPVHEVAVTELVALHRQWVDAHAGPDPGAVSDLLGRWLPGATRRLAGLLRRCEQERAHEEAGHTYQVPTLTADRVALWWVETRGADPTAAQAFAMTPIT